MPIHTEILEKAVSDLSKGFKMGTDTLLNTLKFFEDEQGREPYVAYDEEFPNIVMYVEFPDGSTLENDEYRDEVRDARSEAGATREAERMWRE